MPNPRGYFMWGEVVFLAEHDPGLAPEQLISNLRDKGAIRNVVPHVQFHPGRVLTFDRPEQRSFSLAFGAVDDGSRGNRLIREIREINLQLLHDEDKERKTAVPLIAASPNWLSTGAPVDATGGPGARPSPASPLPAAYHTRDAWEQNTPWAFMLAKLPELQGASATDPVEVAILDTAWDDPYLRRRHSELADRHPLLRGLFGPQDAFETGMLRTQRAGDLGITLPTTMPGLDRIQIRDHVYDMRDHGLFAAGIVHTIAPTARLRLLEVLNPYGIGTSETVGRALHRLLVERQGQKERPPLVINCSLMFTLPLEGHDRVDLPLEEPKTALDFELLERIGWPMEWIYNLLITQDIAVIAAAGNDRVRGSARPSARFPAAFRRVLGVGAYAEDNRNAAPYSNLADRPGRTGILTFGGFVPSVKRTSIFGRFFELLGLTTKGAPVRADATGVRGVYIGAFPGARQTEYEAAGGWAYWAGTSFAAPVISGTLAALIGSGTPSATAVDVVRGAQGDISLDDEEIFSVKHGL
jgi:subtilisin family serine protease